MTGRGGAAGARRERWLRGGLGGAEARADGGAVRRDGRRQRTAESRRRRQRTAGRRGLNDGWRAIPGRGNVWWWDARWSGWWLASLPG